MIHMQRLSPKMHVYRELQCEKFLRKTTKINSVENSSK